MPMDYIKLTCSTSYELYGYGESSPAVTFALAVFIAEVAVKNVTWIEPDSHCRSCPILTGLLLFGGQPGEGTDRHGLLLCESTHRLGLPLCEDASTEGILGLVRCGGRIGLRGVTRLLPRPVGTSVLIASVVVSSGGVDLGLRDRVVGMRLHHRGCAASSGRPVGRGSTSTRCLPHPAAPRSRASSRQRRQIQASLARTQWIPTGATPTMELGFPPGPAKSQPDG